MARRHRKAGLWASAIETQMATWAVLGVRVPQLLTGRMSTAERTRMVAEKLDAIAESGQAAAGVVGRMMLRPARTPGAMAAAATRLAGDVLDPFHRKVTSNAKRLGTARKRRSF